MKNLAKRLKILLKKNEDILDLIIFGSLMKGKIDVNDIDIALLCKSKEGIDRINIKNKIAGILKNKVDIQIIGIEDYSHFIWITLIREGFSVKHNTYLYEMYGIKPVVLYKYSLKEMTISKKVMFERALKNFKGIEKLSNRVVLVPIGISENFNEFLREWGIELSSQEYGLLPLVRKEEF